MSLARGGSIQLDKKFKLTKKLDGSETFLEWKQALQGQLFKIIRCNNIDKLESRITLDDEYFKKDPATAADYKTACRDADNNNCATHVSNTQPKL